MRVPTTERISAADRLLHGEVPARPARILVAVRDEHRLALPEQRRQVQVLAGDDERRVAPERAAVVLAQAIGARSIRVGEQELERVVRQHRLERVAQLGE